MKDDCAVQFLDLVGGNWRFESGSVSNAEACSGCTGGATAGKSTVARYAGGRGGALRHELHIDVIASLRRAARIIATSSEPRGPARGRADAWGIMAPRS